MRCFLAILGVLLLLCLAVLRLRLGLCLAYSKGRLTADILAGPFRIHMLPRNQKKTSKRANKKLKKAAPSHSGVKPERGLPKFTLTDIRSALDTLLPACQKALRRTRRGIRIKPLECSVTMGGALDPAAAAELYGNIHVAIWTGMPVLEQLLVIPDPHIHVGIDFDAPETIAEGTLGISIRLGTLAAVAFGIGIPALKWFLKFQKKQPHDIVPESKKHVKTAPAV